MPHGRVSANKLRWCRALLLVTLPVGCATGVLPELDDTGTPSTGGNVAEGGSGSSSGSHSGGMPGTSGTLPTAGTVSSSGGGGSSGSGGTNAGGGKAGSSSGGATAGSGGRGGGGGSGGRGGSTAGGSAAGGSAAGGSAAGGSSGGASGGAGSGCTCGKTVAWVDDTNVSFVKGDCVTTGGKTYLYTGSKAQTFANGACNPAMQMTWCKASTEGGNDFNFMLCN
jgi:hypothetical protein